jgi:hypothetical protein
MRRGRSSLGLVGLLVTSGWLPGGKDRGQRRPTPQLPRFARKNGSVTPAKPGNGRMQTTTIQAFSPCTPRIYLMVGLPSLLYPYEPRMRELSLTPAHTPADPDRATL